MPSDFEVTDLDSDPAAQVDSDEEFSRVIETPVIDRSEQRPPPTSSTPVRVLNPQEVETRSIFSELTPESLEVRVALNQVKFTASSMESGGASKNGLNQADKPVDSQQTQPVPVLTESQFADIMGEDELSDGDIDLPSENHSSRNGLKGEINNRRKRVEYHASRDASDAFEINSSSESENGELPHSRSTPLTRRHDTNSTVSRLPKSTSVAPSNHQPSQHAPPKYTQTPNTDDEANITPAVSLEVIDETPLRLTTNAEISNRNLPKGVRINEFHQSSEQVYARYLPSGQDSQIDTSENYHGSLGPLEDAATYLLVQWPHDPNWWPCKASLSDFKSKNSRSRVLFRNDEYGEVNLRTSRPFDPQHDDWVHVVDQRGRFRIHKLDRVPSRPSNILTSGGYNTATVVSAKRVILVPVADLYLSVRDIKSNEGEGRSTAEVTTRAFDSTNLNDDSSRNLDTVRPALNATSCILPARNVMGDTTDFGILTDDLDQQAEYTRATSDCLFSSPPRLRSRPKSVPVGQTSREMSRAGTFRNQSPEWAPIRSSPARHTSGVTVSPIRSPGLEVSPRRQARLAAMSDIQLDHFGGSSPPRKRREMKGMSCRQIADTLDGGRGLTTTLFYDHVFTISMEDSESLRDMVVKYGGRVLDRGLSEILKLSDTEDDVSMPDIVFHSKTDDFDRGVSEATFAAVITDKPRRTMKYLEMVALGWPCLHSSFITDCIKQGHLLEWKPYLLPAGETSLVSRKMMVSADIATFHRGWLEHWTLEKHLKCRKITLKLSVPFCVIGDGKSPDGIKLLAALCVPRFRTLVHVNKKNVPDGSIVLDLSTDQDIPRFEPSSSTLIYQMQSNAALDNSCVKSKEWLVQCIIGGTVV